MLERLAMQQVCRWWVGLNLHRAGILGRRPVFGHGGSWSEQQGQTLPWTISNSPFGLQQLDPYPEDVDWSLPLERLQRPTLNTVIGGSAQPGRLKFAYLPCAMAGCRRFRPLPISAHLERRLTSTARLHQFGTATWLIVCRPVRWLPIRSVVVRLHCWQPFDQA